MSRRPLARVDPALSLRGCALRSRHLLDPGLSVTPERFREQVRALARRFRFALPHQVPALLEREAAAPSRERVAVITFDDGYRDNHDLAAPILRDEGAVAAFYVTTTPLTSGHGLWISELYRLVPRLPRATRDRRRAALASGA
ncbi:MAG: polysaccharide deacetylase family protein, partial [Acidobacteria bacterium]|nr:polysaccharide deacetylase family protein [Acidobacteriota bacterium]